LMRAVMMSRLVVAALALAACELHAQESLEKPNDR
jgi:hypothetical protein